MSKKYTAEEILQMAVKAVAADSAADLNRDGEVTASDARIARRAEQALPVPENAGTGEKTYRYEYQPEAEKAGMRASLLDALMQKQDTSVDLRSDKLYNEYRDLYRENAALAAENAYGLAGAMTGGYGSSYAASAATAAYNSYMRSLPEKALEIEKLRTEQRQAQREDLYQQVGLLNSMEQRDYDRRQDELSLAFRAAQQGDYTLLENLEIDPSALRQKDAAALAELGAKYGDYSYLGALGVDTAGISENEAFQKALAAADLGDYSYLEALGYDTSGLKYKDLMQTAVLMAKYGDYSGLEQLGVDVSGLRESEQFERALALAEFGDFSLLGSFTDNLSGLRQKVSVTVQNGAEEAYAYGGYWYLEEYLDRQIGYGQINEYAKQQIINAITGGRYGY